MIPPVGARPFTSVDAPAGAARADIAAPTSLPEARPASSASCDDALAMLYALQAKMDAQDTKTSEQRVVADGAAKQGERRMEQAALEKQDDARRKQEEESHSLWHSLAKSTGVLGKVLEGIAVAALAIECPPAAAAVVAASLAATGLAQIKGPLGVIGSIAGVGIEVGVGVLTGGTSAVAIVAQGAGAAADGTHAIASGVASQRMEDARADAQDAAADTQAAIHRVAVRQMLIEEAIEAMKGTHGDHQRTMETIQGTMQIHDATGVAIASYGRA